MITPQSAAKAVKLLAFIEALTWAGLLFGMFLKYGTHTTEQGVHIFGPIHGTVFALYVVAVAIAARVLHWNLKVTALALLSAVPPFVTLAFERWAQTSGRFEVNPSNNSDGTLGKTVS